MMIPRSSLSGSSSARPCPAGYHPRLFAFFPCGEDLNELCFQARLFTFPSGKWNTRGVLRRTQPCWQKRPIPEGGLKLARIGRTLSLTPHIEHRTFNLSLWFQSCNLHLFAGQEALFVVVFLHRERVGDAAFCSCGRRPFPAFVSGTKTHDEEISLTGIA